jgi:hypothetical protein
VANFQTKNHNLGIYQRDLVYVLYGRLVYFTAIWYILWLFGIFLAIGNIFGYLVYFFPFWYVVPRKIWQT